MEFNVARSPAARSTILTHEEIVRFSNGGTCLLGDEEGRVCVAVFREESTAEAVEVLEFMHAVCAWRVSEDLSRKNYTNRREIRSSRVERILYYYIYELNYLLIER